MLKESFSESQSTRVSTSRNQPDLSNVSLRPESEDTAETLEFSTLTGLPRTLDINTMRSFSLTHPTMPSEETLISTGSVKESISTENREDSPPSERSTEVSDLRDTSLPKLDHQSEPTGEEETPSLSEDTDDSKLDHYFMHFSFLFGSLAFRLWE